MTTQPRFDTNNRTLAVLRAVREGRAEITLSCEPDLKVDGLLFSDQATAHELAHAGLVRPRGLGRPGQWVAAVLGAAALDLLEQVSPASAA